MRTRLEWTISYSYFEKGCLKNVHTTVPKGNMGYDQYTVPDTEAVEPSILLFSFSIGKHTSMGFSCHSFKFLWRGDNSKLPTIPFGIVACTFSDNLSRNSCIQITVFCPPEPRVGAFVYRNAGKVYNLVLSVIYFF